MRVESRAILLVTLQFQIAGVHLLDVSLHPASARAQLRALSSPPTTVPAMGWPGTHPQVVGIPLSCSLLIPDPPVSSMGLRAVSPALADLTAHTLTAVRVLSLKHIQLCLSSNLSVWLMLCVPCRDSPLHPLKSSCLHISSSEIASTWKPALTSLFSAFIYMWFPLTKEGRLTSSPRSHVVPGIEELFTQLMAMSL